MQEINVNPTVIITALVAIIAYLIKRVIEKNDKKHEKNEANLEATKKAINEDLAKFKGVLAEIKESVDERLKQFDNYSVENNKNLINLRKDMNDISLQFRDSSSNFISKVKSLENILSKIELNLDSKNAIVEEIKGKILTIEKDYETGKLTLTDYKNELNKHKKILVSFNKKLKELDKNDLNGNGPKNGSKKTNWFFK